MNESYEDYEYNENEWESNTINNIKESQEPIISQPTTNLIKLKNSLSESTINDLNINPIELKIKQEESKRREEAREYLKQQKIKLKQEETKKKQLLTNEVILKQQRLQLLDTTRRLKLFHHKSNKIINNQTIKPKPSDEVTNSNLLSYNIHTKLTNNKENKESNINEYSGLVDDILNDYRLSIDNDNHNVTHNHNHNHQSIDSNNKLESKSTTKSANPLANQKHNQLPIKHKDNHHETKINSFKPNNYVNNKSNQPKKPITSKPKAKSINNHTNKAINNKKSIKMKEHIESDILDLLNNNNESNHPIIKSKVDSKSAKRDNKIKSQYLLSPSKINKPIVIPQPIEKYQPIGSVNTIIKEVDRMNHILKDLTKELEDKVNSLTTIRDSIDIAPIDRTIDTSVNKNASVVSENKPSVSTSLLRKSIAEKVEKILSSVSDNIDYENDHDIDDQSNSSSDNTDNLHDNDDDKMIDYSTDEPIEFTNYYHDDDNPDDNFNDTDINDYEITNNQLTEDDDNVVIDNDYPIDDNKIDTVSSFEYKISDPLLYHQINMQSDKNEILDKYNNNVTVFNTLHSVKTNHLLDNELNRNADEIIYDNKNPSSASINDLEQWLNKSKSLSKQRQLRELVNNGIPEHNLSLDTSSVFAGPIIKLTSPPFKSEDRDYKFALRNIGKLSSVLLDKSITIDNVNNNLIEEESDIEWSDEDNDNEGVINIYSNVIYDQYLKSKEEDNINKEKLRLQQQLDLINEEIEKQNELDKYIEEQVDKELDDRLDIQLDKVIDKEIQKHKEILINNEINKYIQNSNYQPNDNNDIPDLIPSYKPISNPKISTNQMKSPIELRNELLDELNQQESLFHTAIEISELQANSTNELTKDLLLHLLDKKSNMTELDSHIEKQQKDDTVENPIDSNLNSKDLIKLLIDNKLVNQNDHVYGEENIIDYKKVLQQSIEIDHNIRMTSELIEIDKKISNYIDTSNQNTYQNNNRFDKSTSLNADSLLDDQLDSKIEDTIEKLKPPIFKSNNKNMKSLNRTVDSYSYSYNYEDDIDSIDEIKEDINVNDMDDESIGIVEESIDYKSKDFNSSVSFYNKSNTSTIVEDDLEYSNSFENDAESDIDEDIKDTIINDSIIEDDIQIRRGIRLKSPDVSVNSSINQSINKSVNEIIYNHLDESVNEVLDKSLDKRIQNSFDKLTNESSFPLNTINKYKKEIDKRLTSYQSTYQLKLDIIKSNTKKLLSETKVERKKNSIHQSYLLAKQQLDNERWDIYIQTYKEIDSFNKFVQFDYHLDDTKANTINLNEKENRLKDAFKKINEESDDEIKEDLEEEVNSDIEETSYNQSGSYSKSNTFESISSNIINKTNNIYTSDEIDEEIYEDTENTSYSQTDYSADSHFEGANINRSISNIDATRNIVNINDLNKDVIDEIDSYDSNSYENDFNETTIISNNNNKLSIINVKSNNNNVSNISNNDNKSIDVDNSIKEEYLKFDDSTVTARPILKFDSSFENKEEIESIDINESNNLKIDLFSNDNDIIELDSSIDRRKSNIMSIKNNINNLKKERVKYQLVKLKQIEKEKLKNIESELLNQLELERQLLIQEMESAKNIIVDNPINQPIDNQIIKNIENQQSSNINVILPSSSQVNEWIDSLKDPMKQELDIIDKYEEPLLDDSWTSLSNDKIDINPANNLSNSKINRKSNYLSSVILIQSHIRKYISRSKYLTNKRNRNNNLFITSNRFIDISTNPIVNHYVDVTKVEDDLIDDSFGSDSGLDIQNKANIDNELIDTTNQLDKALHQMTALIGQRNKLINKELNIPVELSDNTNNVVHQVKSNNTEPVRENDDNISFHSLDNTKDEDSEIIENLANSIDESPFTYFQNDKLSNKEDEQILENEAVFKDIDFKDNRVNVNNDNISDDYEAVYESEFNDSDNESITINRQNDVTEESYGDEGSNISDDVEIIDEIEESVNKSSSNINYQVDITNSLKELTSDRLVDVVVSNAVDKVDYNTDIYETDFDMEDSQMIIEPRKNTEEQVDRSTDDFEITEEIDDSVPLVDSLHISYPTDNVISYETNEILIDRQVNQIDVNIVDDTVDIYETEFESELNEDDINNDKISNESVSEVDSVIEEVYEKFETSSNFSDNQIDVDKNLDEIVDNQLLDKDMKQAFEQNDLNISQLSDVSNHLYINVDSSLDMSINSQADSVVDNELDSKTVSWIINPNDIVRSDHYVDRLEDSQSNENRFETITSLEYLQSLPINQLDRYVDYITDVILERTILSHEILSDVLVNEIDSDQINNDIAVTAIMPLFCDKTDSNNEIDIYSNESLDSNVNINIQTQSTNSLSSLSSLPTLLPNKDKVNLKYDDELDSLYDFEIDNQIKSQITEKIDSHVDSKIVQEVDIYVNHSDLSKAIQDCKHELLSRINLSNVVNNISNPLFKDEFISDETVEEINSSTNPLKRNLLLATKDKINESLIRFHDLRHKTSSLPNYLYHKSFYIQNIPLNIQNIENYIVNDHFNDVDDSTIYLTNVISSEYDRYIDVICDNLISRLVKQLVVDISYLYED